MEESLVRSLTSRSRLPLRKLTEPQKAEPRTLNDSKMVIFFSRKNVWGEGGEGYRGSDSEHCTF